jgi:hypothetical protein
MHNLMPIRHLKFPTVGKLKLDTHQQMHYLLNFERFNFTLKLTIIHVYCLICLVHKQCWIVGSYVAYMFFMSHSYWSSWLSNITVMDVPDCPIYALLHVLHFSLYIPLGFLWVSFSVSCWCIVFVARKAIFKLVCWELIVIWIIHSFLSSLILTVVDQ